MLRPLSTEMCRSDEKPPMITPTRTFCVLALCRRAICTSRSLQLLPQPQVVLARLHPFGQRRAQDVGQELRRVHADLGGLVEKERRGQHARRRVRVVEEHFAQRVDEAVDAGVHVEVQGVEQPDAFGADLSARCSSGTSMGVILRLMPGRYLER
jgi:hypothetical protein